MEVDITTIPDDQLRILASEYREMIVVLIQNLESRPNFQKSIEHLSVPSDFETVYRQLLVDHPQLLRAILKASLAVYVNVKNLNLVDAELKRRAAIQN